MIHPGRGSIIILIAFVLSCQSSPENKLPNIILIFADDLGYGDLGTYGAYRYTTPHLDRLAAEGKRFTQFYAAQAVCSASRAALMTGCYPNRIGISGALGPHAMTGIHPQETTIAELLKKKDYATAIAGKWHLGSQLPFLPLQHGFDDYLGLPYSNDMWPVDYDGGPVTEKSIKPHKANYPPLPLIRGNDTIRILSKLDDQDELTTLYTDFAINFIQKNRANPFFLYFAHSMPHVPLGVSDKFKGKSEQGMYGDVIMEIDWSVGEIMKTLEENGLEDNTLIIFTSDNGPWLNYGNHAGSTGALREGKGTSWEGGQKVPCIVKWPEVVMKHSTCNNLAATMDIFPTIAQIVDAPLPAHKIDGVSIYSLLAGQENANPRNSLYYYYHQNDLEAVRKGNWKLVLPHIYRSYEGVLPGNNGFPGPYARGNTELALYNLRRDPGEEYNVIDLYPAIAVDLMEDTEEAREDLGDMLTNRKGNNVRDCGRIRKTSFSSK